MGEWTARVHPASRVEAGADVDGTSIVCEGAVVEKGAKGFSTFDHKGKMSLRASVTSQLAFEDCRIPGDAILPGAEGLRGPLSCLTQARYGVAWGAIGSAMATYQAALDYAKKREACQRVIVTDGIRYAVYRTGEKTPIAYLNLSRLRTAYPIYGSCKGAREALLAMAPEWKNTDLT